MRIAGLVQDSIVDGPGFRYVVFTQGCRFDCEGCHNPDTRDIGGGVEMSAEEIINDMLSNPLTDGLTLSGGEPFDQVASCVSLAAAARENGLNVWIFTGMTFEELRCQSEECLDTKRLLELTDVLVDGRFILKERTLNIKWCGSKNQRVIDVQKSLSMKRGELCLV